MKTMNKHHFVLVIGAIALISTLTTTADAQDAVYGQPGDWLAGFQTAQSAGMGGAFTANAEGALGSMWNPAGLSRTLQNEARFETGSLFGESRMNAFSVTVPGRRFPSFGLSMVTLNSGEFQRTNELNDDLGTFDNGNLALYLTGAKKVTPRLRVGASVKMVRQTVEEFSAGAVGMDLGVMFDFNQHWRVGASALNIGGPNLSMREVEESYPINLRGGLTYRGLGGRALLTAEVDSREGPGTLFNTGGEVWVHKSFALRAGLANTDLGAGMSYRMAHNFRFDYSAQDNELGVVHRFGFTYGFGGFHATSQARPEIFSPTGDNAVTSFGLKAHTRGEPEEWQLDIIDKHNEVVRRFGGKGGPPAHVVWDGTNEAGMPLPDGTYRYRLLVRDDQGIELDAKEQQVVISTAGPQGAIPVEVE